MLTPLVAAWRDVNFAANSKSNNVKEANKDMSLPSGDKNKVNEEEELGDPATTGNPFESITRQVAKSQLDQLTTYYKSALNEKKKGVYIALIIAFVGFLFFVFSVGLLGVQWYKATINNTLVANANTASVNAATASVICGSLLEFVALATFYFYGRVSTDLQDHLDINQRFLLANIICEGMDSKSRQKAQAKLVEALLEYKEQDSKKTAETERVNNTSSANQSPPAPGRGKRESG